MIVRLKPWGDFASFAGLPISPLQAPYPLRASEGNSVSRGNLLFARLSLASAQALLLETQFRFYDPPPQ